MCGNMLPPDSAEAVLQPPYRVYRGQYPLRPELLESAYIMHGAFGRAPRYLRLAEGTLATLERHNRCSCGFCSVQHVDTGAATPPGTSVGTSVPGRLQGVR